MVRLRRVPAYAATTTRAGVVLTRLTMPPSLTAPEQRIRRSELLVWQRSGYQRGAFHENRLEAEAEANAQR
jgi:hypothetical protein